MRRQRATIPGARHSDALTSSPLRGQTPAFPFSHNRPAHISGHNATLLTHHPSGHMSAACVPSSRAPSYCCWSMQHHPPFSISMQGIQASSTRNNFPKPLVKASANRTSSSSSSSGSQSNRLIKPVQPKQRSRWEGRRQLIIKPRQPPRHRKNSPMLDVPRALHLDPKDPSFAGRMDSEINKVYGPK
jgi:hypothetical protein